jgi:hypothetical protein
VKTYQGKHSKSAILILEEAFHFLRSAPAALFISYYVGSLPFILGLLYFWADMSRSGFAADYLAVGSLGIAALFVWMKFWHAIFGRQIRSLLSGDIPEPLSSTRMLSMAVNQTLIHATGLFVLPLAAVLMAPFGWLYAFYQNATAQESFGADSFRTMYKRAWRQAKLWPVQNHLLLLILFVFGLAVFINVFIVLFISPYLLKKFTGIETVFTLSGLHAVNTMLVTSALAVSHLSVDPLIKIAYALRCYYGEAITTGADLKTELKSFRVKTVLLTAVLAMVILSPLQICAFQQMGFLSEELSPISSEQLDQSIDEVLERREFAWRMPREKPDQERPEESGPFISALRWVLEKIKKIFKTISKWLQELEDWFDNLWPRPSQEKTADDFDWRPFTKFLFILLLIALAVAVVYFAVKYWRNYQSSREEIESEAEVDTPDLRDEGVKADDLPVNRWLDLAKELIAKGSLRLAMRALYLATLAYLSEKELIRIEFYKSNRDYECEVHRRAHEKKELVTAFSKTVMIFDRVWYGMHSITRGDVDSYIADQKRIMAIVEEQ